jgi:hypothetical protein
VWSKGVLAGKKEHDISFEKDIKEENMVKETNKETTFS